MLHTPPPSIPLSSTSPLKSQDQKKEKHLFTFTVICRYVDIFHKAAKATCPRAVRFHQIPLHPRYLVVYFRVTLSLKSMCSNSSSFIFRELSQNTWSTLCEYYIIMIHEQSCWQALDERKKLLVKLFKACSQAQCLKCCSKCHWPGPTARGFRCSSFEQLNWYCM